MGMHVHMYMGTYIHVWRPEVHIRYLPQQVSTLFIDAGLLVEPRAHLIQLI